MTQSLLTVLIVALAAVYALWQLLPLPLRQTIAERLRRRSAQQPQSALLPLAARIAAAPTGGCAGCGARAQCPAQRRNAGC